MTCLFLKNEIKKTFTFFYSLPEIPENFTPKNVYMSVQFRQRVVELYQNGRTQCDVAKTLNISQSAVSKILCKFRTQGGVENRRKSGRPRKITPMIDKTIKRLSLKIFARHQVK